MLSPSIQNDDPSSFGNLWVVPQQTFSRMYQVSGAVVSVGTSKAIILEGSELIGLDLDPEEAVLALMRGRNPIGKLDSHYQDNKVAIIWSGPSNESFIFQFFQYDKGSDRVISSLECSNVSAACGAYALLKGIARLDNGLFLYGINDNTGQHIVLTPADPAMPAWSLWNVRFVELDPMPNFFPFEEGLKCTVGDEETEFWAFEKGNAFVFARTNPETASKPLIEALVQLGKRQIHSGGGNSTKAAVPKVMLYDITGAENGVIRIKVVCHFINEQHKSLPGSAAMALAGFLTQNHLLTNLPDTPYGSYFFNMQHPSGQVDVQVDWTVSAYGVHILSTEFVTPTSVLFDGSFFIDGGLDVSR